MHFAALNLTEKSKAAYTKEGFTLFFSVQTAHKSMNTGLLDSTERGRLLEENCF